MRVVLTGSESTGKTTLADALAAHYGVEFVPEFVRQYAAAKSTPLDFSDHGPIAHGQIALEEEYVQRAQANASPVARRSPRVALSIQDTDLLSTVVYCDHYFGRCPQWIADAARDRRPDLYLLCEIDLPWVHDGIRDRGDRRDEMQQLFRDAVRASGAPFVVIEGLGDERTQRAIDAIDELLLQGDAP